MKKTNNSLMTAVILCGAFVLAGCSNAVSDSKSNPAGTISTNSISESSVQGTTSETTQSNSEATESDVDSDSIIFDDFKISIDIDRAMNTYIIDNQFSELNGRKVYAVPMIIENNGSETKGINMFYVKAFGSKGTELNSVYAYFDEAQDFYKELRPGAKMQTEYYMLDDGSGEYCIVFKNFTEEKELVVNIG